MKQLLLLFSFELSISIFPLPFSTSGIQIKSGSMHQVLFPFAFVYCPISELIDSFSVLFVIFPLSFVDSSTSIMINAIALHFIFQPWTFISFCSQSVGGVTRYFQDSFAMFHLDAIEKPPITFVNSAIYVLELAIAMKLMFRNLRLLLFWRLFYDFFLGLFFRSHFYNLSFKSLNFINFI